MIDGYRITGQGGIHPLDYPFQAEIEDMRGIPDEKKIGPLEFRNCIFEGHWYFAGIMDPLFSACVHQDDDTHAIYVDYGGDLVRMVRGWIDHSGHYAAHLRSGSNLYAVLARNAPVGLGIGSIEGRQPKVSRTDWDLVVVQDGVDSDHPQYGLPWGVAHRGGVQYWRATRSVVAHATGTDEPIPLPDESADFFVYEWGSAPNSAPPVSPKAPNRRPEDYFTEVLQLPATALDEAVRTGEICRYVQAMNAWIVDGFRP